jgi:hypothetical protein
MVAADARKESLKEAEAELKADTAEAAQGKKRAGARNDEAALAELMTRRNALRAGVGEDAAPV